MSEIEPVLQRLYESIRRDSPDRAAKIIATIQAFRAGLGPEDALWHDLNLVLHDAQPGESLADRLGANPWEHPDPRVVGTWRKITDPANETHLKAWYEKREKFNPAARSTVEAAWTQLQERKRAGPSRTPGA